MINWRNGKGGFVGGLKTIIRGVFQFTHSITSATPVGPTPDCFVGFIGTLIDPTVDPVGFIGAISGETGFSSTIDASGLGLVGSMSDDNGFIGDLCND